LNLPPINNELLRQKELEFNKLDVALKSLREQSAEVKQTYKSDAYTHLQSTQNKNKAGQIQLTKL
jgi:hypothetical protein